VSSGSLEPGGPASCQVGDPLAMHWRSSLLLVSAFTTVLLASVTLLFPVPYVVLEPGPAINTLGRSGAHPLISVKDRATYPAKGSLDLTTVTITGGPQSPLSVYQVLGGWFDPDQAVVPVKVMFPPGETAESTRKENEQEMVSSQESAVVAALRELDIRVPTTLTVHSVDPGTPASTLAPGDVLVAVNGTAIVDLEGLSTILSTVTPGRTVSATVRRKGVRTVVRTPTRRWEDGRTVLGIRVDPTFRPPFEVKISIDNIGGPSAGTMFALGIIDILTPGDLTGGRHIAGTGTIDALGSIGPIGGIRQKIAGAREAGATWFLAPRDNCGEVVGHVPDGLRVVAVDTLGSAREAVERIAGSRDLDSLPACTP
jgi:PDZ domain-containing protein